MNIRETEEYKSGLFEIVTCPVCGNETLDMYYICPNCDWEYDGVFDDDDYSSANHSTLIECKEQYSKFLQYMAE